MLTAILFDLDGTLANTDPIHFAVWRDILQPYGIALNRDVYDSTFSGRLNVDIIRDILPHLSLEDARDLGDRKEAGFRERAASELVPLAGLLDLLQWTEDHGIKRGVVTNAPPANANFMIDSLELRPWFQTVVIGEELERGKPHPLPYCTGLKRLSVSADQAIAFEDSPSGVQSAHGAGIFTIGVASTHGPERLQHAGAQQIIFDFTDTALASTLAELSPSRAV